MKRAIAFGFFDGIHIGHAELLKKAKQRAGEIGAEPSVLSFDVHPDLLVHNKEVPLITDCADREDIIKRCFSIDNVVFIHFNKRVMEMPWQKFADTVIEELDAVWFVVGYDFKFGRYGEGTAEKLKDYLEEKNIGCDIIPAVKLDGRTVSSTYIRTLIEKGDMEEAKRFLGRPHCLSDKVHSGYHIGEKLAAPTINLFFPPNVIVPRYGVYATKVIISGDKEYEAVTNVGVRPTFGDNNKVTVESHLLDYEGNLYGTPARVDFYKFIRPERKFDDYNKLSEQIKIDAETTREYFKANPKSDTCKYPQSRAQ